MMIRRGSLVILATLLLSSCSDIQEAIGTPKDEEFTDWFKWFVDFFKPNDLSSNQEVIIFTLLILIILGVCAALMN